MPVTITITGDDAFQAIVELRDLAEAVGGIFPAVSDRPIAAPAEPVVITMPAAAEAPAPVEAEEVEKPAEKKRGRPKKAERQISAQPEAREPDAAEAALDEEDEAAEAVEAAPSVGEVVKITHDDVRSALGQYVKKFGMEAAQADGPKILGFSKISEIPDDQSELRGALERVNAAVAADSRFGG